jgi:hypothetical protein
MGRLEPARHALSQRGANGGGALRGLARDFNHEAKSQ